MVIPGKMGTQKKNQSKWGSKNLDPLKSGEIQQNFQQNRETQQKSPSKIGRSNKTPSKKKSYGDPKSTKMETQKS